jgi:hypothetical protein
MLFLLCKDGIFNHFFSLLIPCWEGHGMQIQNNFCFIKLHNLLATFKIRQFQYIVYPRDAIIDPATPKVAPTQEDIVALRQEMDNLRKSVAAIPFF